MVLRERKEHAPSFFLGDGRCDRNPALGLTPHGTGQWHDQTNENMNF
jgi:hypothetical protein